jgi:CRP-like cAMP-binding protein
LKYLLCQIGPGQYFGEIGMLFGEYRDTTVVARTSVEVLEVKYSDLRDVMKDFPLVQAYASLLVVYIALLQKYFFPNRTSH